MITISLSLNNTTSTTTTSASDIRSLAIEKLGHANVTAKINGAEVTLAARIQHADAVSLQITVAPAPRVEALSGFAFTAVSFIEVSYINNDGSGFADKLRLQSGITISQLISQKGVDAGRFQVRVNSNIVTADTVLNNGDKVSVTPAKIEGAAEVLYVNNDGSGFADKVQVIDGITLRQFFAQRTQSADANRYLIRVNGQAAAQDQVLNNGDKVSITPTKIQGAKA